MSTWPLRPPGPCASSDLSAILRENFNHRLSLPGVRLPCSLLQKATLALKPLRLQMDRKIESTTEAEDGYKVILLDPEKVAQHDQLLSPQAKAVLEEMSVVLPPPLLPVALTYEHYKLEQVLRVILPPEIKISAFSQIGHIAHLNLKPEILPYKFLIGQAIIDKIPIVKTVVNKTDQIDNIYRNFQMELVAGEANFVATQSANGCSFQLDFSKVYWNSRLVTEHARLADQLEPGDVLYDAFAGVGPFALPAARRGCRVLANDLNPESFKWLQTNLLLNCSRRTPLAVSCSNMDARQFLETVVAGDYRWEARRQAGDGLKRRIFLVMNLPGLAVTFLDALKLLPHPNFVHQLEGQWNSLPDLNVRCYCFLKATTNQNATSKEASNENATSKEATNQNATSKEASNENATSNEVFLTQDNVKEVLQRTLRVRRLGDLQLHFVRNVASSKDMFRLDFKVTGAMFKEMWRMGRAEEPAAKRARSEKE